MEVIEDFVAGKSEDEEIKIDINEKQYKATINYETKNLDLTVKITRIGEADIFNVEFIKKNGYLEDFLEFVAEIENDVNKKFGYLEKDDEEDQDQ